MNKVLNATELQSTVWMKLKQELYKELGVLRTRNEGDLGEVETAHVRGEIHAINRIIGIETVKVQFKPAVASNS